MIGKPLCTQINKKRGSVDKLSLPQVCRQYKVPGAFVEGPPITRTTYGIHPYSMCTCRKVQVQLWNFYVKLMNLKIKNYEAHEFVKTFRSCSWWHVAQPFTAHFGPGLLWIMAHRHPFVSSLYSFILFHSFGDRNISRHSFHLSPYPCCVSAVLYTQLLHFHLIYFI